MATAAAPPTSAPARARATGPSRAAGARSRSLRGMRSLIEHPRREDRWRGVYRAGIGHDGAMSVETTGVSSGEVAHILGLRLEADRTGAEWFTLWFDDDDRKLLDDGGKILWVRSPREAAGLLSVRGGHVELSAEEPAVLDLVDLVGQLSKTAPRDPGRFWTEIDLVDDLNMAVDSLGLGLTKAFGSESTAVLNRVRDALMDGKRVGGAIKAGGGTETVSRAVFEMLGRALACSRFS